VDIDNKSPHSYRLLTYAIHNHFSVDFEFERVYTTHTITSPNKKLEFVFESSFNDPSIETKYSVHTLVNTTSHKRKKVTVANRVKIFISDYLSFQTNISLGNHIDIIDFVAKIFRSIMYDNPTNTVKLIRTTKFPILKKK
jgi:hypothetical protein